MIILTKLDNSTILVNLDTVKYIEHTPDTLISFLNGDRIMVRESLEEIRQSMIELQREILRESKDD